MAAGLTAQQIAREYFPQASDDELENIIWGYTGFPAFWNIPADGKTPTQCFRKQLREHKADRKANRRGCWALGAPEALDAIEEQMRCVQRG